MDIGLVVALLVGIAAGFVGGIVAVRIRPSLAGGRAAEEEAIRRQAAYRREVADHFVETAQLVNRLTDSYKEVFDHLREGAGKLVDEETLRERLANEENKDVTLQLIGYRTPEKPGARPGTSAEKRGKSDGKRA